VALDIQQGGYQASKGFSISCFLYLFVVVHKGKGVII
jgi:hypothetical protein